MQTLLNRSRILRQANAGSQRHRGTEKQASPTIKGIITTMKWKHLTQLTSVEVEFIEQEVRVGCNHETRTEYYEAEPMNKDGNEKYDN